MKRIPLWNSDDSFALVDDQDYAWLTQWRWRADDKGYAVTSFGGARVFMHAMLITVPGGCMIDHSNRNRTDNRRENLRFASARQNSANVGRRTGAREAFVGVRQIASGRWVARIGEGGRHVGVFDTAEEAAQARDHAAIKEYGVFATLNFSPDEERSVDSRPRIAVPRKDSRRELHRDRAKSRRGASAKPEHIAAIHTHEKRTRPSKGKGRSNGRSG